MHLPGREKTYLVRVIQSVFNGDLGDYEDIESDVSSTRYRIPFYVPVNGRVTSRAGAGVEGVLVSLCHVNRTTGTADAVGTPYCPLYLNTKSDIRGYFSGEIRVSNPDWLSTEETFIVSAHLTELWGDGTEFVHEFEPNHFEQVFYHVQTQNLILTDLSTVSILGRIIYEPNQVGAFTCPVADVSVTLTDSNDEATEATSNETGHFSFSVIRNEHVYITLPDYYNHTFSFELWQQGNSLIEGVHYDYDIENGNIYLNESVTSTSVSLTIFDTSVQRVRLGVVGAQHEQYDNLFGKETKFQLSALDSEHCAYSFVASLDDSGNSFYDAYIPAMEYEVSVIESYPHKPVFSIPVFDPMVSAGRIYCADSETPLDHFTKTNQLVQELPIVELHENPYELKWIYRTGICLQISGSSWFSVVKGEGDGTHACYDDTVEHLTEGESFLLPILLFEYYPFGLFSNSDDGYFEPSSLQPFRTEKSINDSTIYIFDQVSGWNSAKEFEYEGESYTHRMTAALPNVLYPFAWKFYVTAVRAVQESAVEVTSDVFYIPVLGSRSKEVPNFYPVASDPNLIFLVLRDPPGGSSYTKFSSATSVDFELAIESMNTYNGEFSGSYEASVGLDSEYEVVCCLGSGTSTEMVKISDSKEFGTTNKISVKNSRESSKHYKFSMNFAYDIATSQDPYIAGHASDIIVGGGVDLVVNEAIVGTFLCYPHYYASHVYVL